ncbi:hypothetical protein HPB50_011694 [Hyalomma asiaticum]|uniref:Uncharacterized protein n=1 Tax=Hyalomma asiaticum TaxID=266040 RepID=A0ACB7SXM5_HYAAI|nr:hypothetical protein HPB50_011694 [Hyalomma asiaticum]
MFDPCHSRSSSVKSAERTRTSDTIGASFSDEEQGATGYAESSMGAPPIIENTAVMNIFNNDTRDNRKGVGIIRRTPKEKKSAKLKPRATRASGRDEDTTGVAAGAPKNSGGIRIYGNGGHLSLVTCESVNRSPTLAAMANNRYQPKQRQSRARSLTSGRGDGRTIHSGTDKKHKRKKDDSKKGQHVKERHHGKVTDYAATSSPQEFTPPLLLSPTLIHNCTVRTNEEPMQATTADVLPIKKADQGDSGTMPKYKQNYNSVLAATGDGKHSRQDMKGTVNRRGREINDEGRAYTSVKDTAPEVAVTWGNEAPLGETTQSAVTGYVFVDPSTPVREFRYAETVQTGYGSAGQQPWRQPRRPHPLCPVHSPQSDRGQIPLSARYSSPPQGVPTPAPWTWVQEQPPLQYGEPVYSPSGTAPVPDYQFHGGQFSGSAWYPAQQPSTVGWDGGADPGYIWSGGFTANPHPQYAGPSAAIPAQLPLYQENAYQGTVAFHQMSPQPYGRQGDANFIPAQFAQTLIQQEHMDRESSPCDNFYRYVCKIRPGNPAQQLGGGTFASVDARLEESIASSLRDYILNERHRDVALVRALYSTCLRPTGHSLAALQKEVFSKLPMKRWPYKGSTLRSSNIWQMAGTLVRRFGVVSILEVSLGIKPSTTRPTIELRYPRYLHADDYSLGGVDALRDAVLEATRELGSSDDGDNLVSQVMSVATTLAALSSNATVRQVLFTRCEDLAVNIRTFIQSLFEGELRRDVVVALREPRLLTEQLQALITTANVTAFINYLGFRIIVYFAALSDSNRVASLQSVLSSEATGRVIPPEKKWFLCLQLVDRVQPACLGHALAMQQAAERTSAATRLWLARLEDQFYRNLPSVAWMTERSLKKLGDKLESLPIMNAVDAPSWNMCTVRPLNSLDEGSTLRMFAHAAGEYQRERLRQINKASRPLDPGRVFDMQSRYSDSLQAVRVPLGLVNGSAVAEGELLAFQAARTAVRFYMGLLPITYEHWDSNLQDTESPWALSISSRRSLDRVLECLAYDYRTQWSSSFSPWVPVVREVAEDRYPLLAQTTALALAYAAFKELLHDEHHQRLDVRLQSLSDSFFRPVVLRVLRAGQLRIRRRDVPNNAVSHAGTLARRAPREFTTAALASVRPSFSMQRAGCYFHGGAATATCDGGAQTATMRRDALEFDSHIGRDEVVQTSCSSPREIFR